MCFLKKQGSQRSTLTHTHRRTLARSRSSERLSYGCCGHSSWNNSTLCSPTPINDTITTKKWCAVTLKDSSWFATSHMRRLSAASSTIWGVGTREICRNKTRFLQAAVYWYTEANRLTSYMDFSSPQTRRVDVFIFKQWTDLRKKASRHLKSQYYCSLSSSGHTILAHFWLKREKSMYH